MTSPYVAEYSEPAAMTENEYNQFRVIPIINLYWIDKPSIKDRGITIGWLFWEYDIQLSDPTDA